MPIWLRNFTFSRIQDHYSEQSKEIEKANKGTKLPGKSPGTIKRPTYSTKVKK